MAGIPQQVLVAVPDEIAAIDELKLQIAVRERVREALVDGGRRLRRTAIEPRQRHLRRSPHRRVETKQADAEPSSKQNRNSTHCLAPSGLDACVHCPFCAGPKKRLRLLPASTP